MERNSGVVGLTILLVLLLAGGAQAFEIFFWQHDNNQAVQDPVYNTRLTSTQSLVRALNDLDLDYTLNRNLPNDLSGYDVVMTSLSYFCDS